MCSVLHVLIFVTWKIKTRQSGLGLLAWPKKAQQMMNQALQKAKE